MMTATPATAKTPVHNHALQNGRPDWSMPALPMASTVMESPALGGDGRSPGSSQRTTPLPQTTQVRFVGSPRTSAEWNSITPCSVLAHHRDNAETIATREQRT